MVVFEAAGQGLAEIRHLRPGLPDGQIGQHHRVTLTGNECFEHGAGRHTQRLGQHERGLDAGVLEHFLQPIQRARTLSDQAGALPGEVTKTANARWRHERRRDQPVLGHLRDPTGVGDVGLTAWHPLDVAGVDQPDLKPPFLKQVEHGFPVVRCCLHDDQLNVLLGQPVRQQQQ